MTNIYMTDNKQLERAKGKQNNTSTNDTNAVMIILLGPVSFSGINAKSALTPFIHTYMVHYTTLSFPQIY